jgi:hydroxymethylglutaryl-CoA lyase
VTAENREVVLINDVGPRDGLQNQSKILTADQRASMIASLVNAGLKAIEVGAFVSPKVVPAMAHTDSIAASLPAQEVNYSALIPNRKGYDLARACDIESVNLVVAATNTMNEENIGMTTARAMAVSREVIEQGRKDKVVTQAYIATAWVCPFEGVVAEKTVIELTGQLLSAGASSIVLADTIGAANPSAVKSLVGKLVTEYGADKFCCHFHDTRAMGVANVYAALEGDIRRFDSSVGGLGGCPFAPGATGNVATEDVVLMLEQEGFDTGIDLEKLVQTVDLVSDLTGNCEGGHSIRWLRRQIEKGSLLDSIH